MLTGLRKLGVTGINKKNGPEWIKELPHLVKLKLVDTKLLEHDAALEFLGKLPKLEILVLLWKWSVFEGRELAFKSLQAGIAFGSLRVLSLGGIGKLKSVKFEEGIMPKLELLQVTGALNIDIGFSGIEFLPSVKEVRLHVRFPWDYRRIYAAPDSETRDKIREEERQEEARKKGELKNKIQDQLAWHANEPIVVTER